MPSALDSQWQRAPTILNAMIRVASNAPLGLILPEVPRWDVLKRTLNVARTLTIMMLVALVLLVILAPNLKNVMLRLTTNAV